MRFLPRHVIGSRNILEAKNGSFEGHKITFGQYFTGGRQECMASAGAARSTCADIFIYCVCAVLRRFLPVGTSTRRPALRDKVILVLQQAGRTFGAVVSEQV